MDEKLLDKMSNIALINLYSISKDSKSIKLFAFDTDDPNHLGIYNIAKIASQLWHYPIYLQTNLFKYLIFKRKTKDTIKWINPYKEEKTTVQDFINHITYANNCIGIFSEIYHKYYERKNNK